MPMMIPEAPLPRGFPKPGPIGQVIVKEYPAYRAAIVRAPEGSGEQNRMFGVLFSHITKNDIAMTSPVEMKFDQATQSDRPISMAFLYGDPGMRQAGKEGAVEVEDAPPQTVLSYAVRGGYGWGTYEKGVAAIEKYLAAHEGTYAPAGEYRFFGYNSPFVPPFMRISEIQLPVRVVAAEAEPQRQP